MSSSALVAVVRAGSANEDDARRVQADADRVESLVAEANGLSEPTGATCDRLRAIAMQIDQLVGPWRTNHPAAPLVVWHENLRRTVYLQAVKIFGVTTAERIAPKPLEPLTISARPRVARLFRF